MGLDKLAAGFNFVAHQLGEELICEHGIAQRDLR